MFRQWIFNKHIFDFVIKHKIRLLQLIHHTIEALFLLSKIKYVFWYIYTKNILRGIQRKYSQRWNCNWSSIFTRSGLLANLSFSPFACLFQLKHNQFSINLVRNVVKFPVFFLTWKSLNEIIFNLELTCKKQTNYINNTIY